MTKSPIFFPHSERSKSLEKWENTGLLQGVPEDPPRFNARNKLTATNTFLFKISLYASSAEHNFSYCAYFDIDEIHYIFGFWKTKVLNGEENATSFSSNSSQGQETDPNISSLESTRPYFGPHAVSRPFSAFETEKYAVDHKKKGKVSRKKWPSVFFRCSKCSLLTLRPKIPGSSFDYFANFTRPKETAFVGVCCSNTLFFLLAVSLGLLAFTMRVFWPHRSSEIGKEKEGKWEEGRIWPQPRSWHLLTPSCLPLLWSVYLFRSSVRIFSTNCTNDVTFTFEISRCEDHSLSGVKHNTLCNAEGGTQSIIFSEEKQTTLP